MNNPAECLSFILAQDEARDDAEAILREIVKNKFAGLAYSRNAGLSCDYCHEQNGEHLESCPITKGRKLLGIEVDG